MSYPKRNKASRRRRSSSPSSGVGDEVVYRWFWKTRLPERRDQRCRVLARGALNSCLIEFLSDGHRVVTSRYALRKL